MAIAPSAASAVVPGEAGRILFTSGRDLGDTFSKLHFCGGGPLLGFPAACRRPRS